MVIDKRTTLAGFSAIEPLLTAGTAAGIFERLKTRAKPREIAGKPLPENLNLISWAQFAALSSLDGQQESFFAPFEIILGLNREQLRECTLFDTVGFLLFVKNELERIAKLFESIKHSPTPEELQAGINGLNFGLFGTLDWYARRMGFADHAEAEKTPLIRIYKCLEIDSKTAKFENRLRTVVPVFDQILAAAKRTGNYMIMFHDFFLQKQYSSTNFRYYPIFLSFSFIKMFHYYDLLFTGK